MVNPLIDLQVELAGALASTLAFLDSECNTEYYYKCLTSRYGSTCMEVDQSDITTSCWGDMNHGSIENIVNIVNHGTDVSHI